MTSKLTSTAGGGSSCTLIGRKICMVCGDKALGYNFNAVTCESCKAFFRRNALSNKEFTCPFNGDCTVTVITRRFCQKCRLQKCFDVGMKKEFIMSEEDKVLKRKKIEQNRAKKRSTNTSFSEKITPIKIKKENSLSNDESDSFASIRTSPHTVTSVIINTNQLQGFNYDVPSPDNIAINTSYNNSPLSLSSPPSDDHTNSSPHTSNHTADLFSEYIPHYSNNPSNSNSPNAISSTTNGYSTPNFRLEQSSSLFTPQVTSKPSEIVAGILNSPYGAKYMIDLLMKTPSDAVFVMSKIINSPNDAMELISHLIASPGDALHIISKIMNSPLDALTVFTQFMSSPTDSFQIIEKIISSPSDVLQFMQQLMNSPENALQIMNKFMSCPVEALKIINKMINHPDVETVSIPPTTTTTAPNQNQCYDDKNSMIKSMLNALKTDTSNSTSPLLYDANNPNSSSSCDNFSYNHLSNHTNLSQIQKTEEIVMNVIEDIEKIPVTPHSFESMLCEAIRLEYESYNVMEHSSCNGLDLNSVETNKLEELIFANEALYDPVDDEYEIATSRLEENHAYPELLRVINLTAVAVRRLIKMAKKISAFKNMCQEDQMALLKGGCIEMMILRSVMQYDEDRNLWTIPHRKANMSNIKADVLKLAKGNIYEKHKTFISNFDKKWRSDMYIIPIMCAITLFTPDRPRTVHSDVVKLEQTSYYCLLRRYLESIYTGCEAKSTFLKLIEKIHELKKLNDEVINVYLDVNPSQIEPLLIEIFDLRSTNL